VTLRYSVLQDLSLLTIRLEACVEMLLLRGVYVYCLTEELREGRKTEVNPHHNDSSRSL